jgi:two-component system, chemotaxis family, CheB/CheR fusion protein
MAGEAPPLRILIVDDSPDAASVLALMLWADGHEARTADDGLTAVRRAEATPPDVVICDLAMPGMDGYEVARRLRATPGLERVTLIAMTGFGHDEDRDRSRSAGFDHHLVKPVDPTELERILEMIALNSSPPR